MSPMAEWLQMMQWSRPHAARRLGLSAEAVRAYERGARRDGGTVITPRAVELACLQLSRSLEGEDLKRALRVQNPTLASNFIALPIRIEKERGSADFLALPALQSDVSDWLAENCPTAELKYPTLKIGYGHEISEFLIPVITFSNPSEAVHFRLRW